MRRATKCGVLISGLSFLFGILAKEKKYKVSVYKFFGSGRYWRLVGLLECLRRFSQLSVSTNDSTNCDTSDWLGCEPKFPHRSGSYSLLLMWRCLAIYQLFLFLLTKTTILNHQDTYLLSLLSYSYKL